MSSYLIWQQQDISLHNTQAILELYNQGFLFGRDASGRLHQTRSIRIHLPLFRLSSENRRILRKHPDMQIATSALPMPEYSWGLGKMVKDFYDQKFGLGTFSANKAKELLSSSESNFNTFLRYYTPTETIGYTICYEQADFIHYAYPFYNLEYDKQNIGMSMMIQAIQYAKEMGKTYLYLGSAQRPTDIYKLQFAGLEWFDGKEWQQSTEELKNILLTASL